MSDFNTHKWLKKQYLAEANLTEEKLPYIPPDAFWAIYNILKSEVPEIQSEYGTASYFGMQMREKLDMYRPGEEILMGLKEAPESTLNLSQADMDKLHKDGKLEIDGHKILYKIKENLNEEMATYKVEVVLAADEGGPDSSEDVEVKVDSSLKGDKLNSAIRNAVYDKGYTRRSIYKINYKK